MNQQDQITKCTQELVALHRLYVEMADNVSQRRDSANKFFLTLATTPVGLLVLASSANQDIFSDQKVLLTVSIVGLVISIIWTLNLIMYRTLNRAKFDVIMEIERHLSHSGFSKEWELLKARRYRGLTVTELLLPGFVILFYLVVILFLAWAHFGV